MLLQVKDVAVFYGESRVCGGIDLHVNPGEEVCLLGRNGVGKTTLLKCIMRLLPNREGSLLFNGLDMNKLKPHEAARLGVAYVPQGRMIFPNHTVLENLLLGTTARTDKVRKIPEIVFEYFPILKDRLKQQGGTLSGGEQQMLAIGRALSCLPKLILLDEPSEGLSPKITFDLIEILKKLCKETDLAILLVEQNFDVAMEVTSRGYVMEKGCIVAQGKIVELQSDAIVRSHLIV